MNFNECVDIEYKKCLKLLNIAKKTNFNDTKGRLISSKNNKLYHVYNNEENGCEVRKYINRKNIQLARELASKSYLDNVRQILEKRLYILKELKDKFEIFEIENFYNSMPKNRKELSNLVNISYQQHLKAWKAMPYTGLGFLENAPVIMTKKGERVRSKTEKIIADLLYDYGIEYKYECPIFINGKVYYPDFTFLCPYTLKEIYWEHHGLMDDAKYCNKTIRKLINYEKNGIIRGENLIVTYESEDNVIDMEWVKILIEKHLLHPFVEK